jgi:hypothetical protein
MKREERPMSSSIKTRLGIRAVRRNGVSSGMTLLEIMLALSILVAISIGFLFTAMGTVRLNRMTELEISGSNIISGQLDALMTAGLDNRDLAHGTAKGIVLYLQRLNTIIGSGAMDPDNPIRINMQNGVLYYEFPVTNAGYVPGAPVTAGPGAAMPLHERQYPLARGVVEIYLKEDVVPAVFREWNDLNHVDHSSDDVTPVQNTFFDMDGDQKNGGDFTALFTNSVNTYPSSKLTSLPVSITIHYYANADMMTRAINMGPMLSNDPSTSSLYLGRRFIVNNDSVIGLGIY